MAPLSAVPLKHKLTLIVMATSMAALLLVGGCFLIYELITTPEAVARNLSSLASVIANNSTTALAFDDQDAAQETLSGLRTMSNITTAIIYRNDGSPFAGYWRDGTNASPPPCLRDSPTYRHAGQYVEICRKIELRGETLGTIALRSDLREAYARLRNYAQIVGLAFGFAARRASDFLGLAAASVGPDLGSGQGGPAGITGAELRDSRSNQKSR